MVSGKTDVGLLGAVRANKGVDLEGISTQDILHSLLDLVLVGAHVDLQDKGVVGFDLGNGGLRTDVGDQDLLVIQARTVINSLGGVLGLASELKGGRKTESSVGVVLGGLLTVGTLKCSLTGLVGFGSLCSGHWIQSACVRRFV